MLQFVPYSKHVMTLQEMDPASHARKEAAEPAEDPAKKTVSLEANLAVPARRGSVAGGERLRSSQRWISLLVTESACAHSCY